MYLYVEEEEKLKIYSQCYGCAVNLHFNYYDQKCISIESVGELSIEGWCSMVMLNKSKELMCQGGNGRYFHINSGSGIKLCDCKIKCEWVVMLCNVPK